MIQVDRDRGSATAGGCRAIAFLHCALLRLLAGTWW